MEIAIAHDYLTQHGGAERVLDVFLDIFPSAELYVLTYSEEFAKPNIHASFIKNLPKINYRNYMPLFPLAIRLMNIDADMILSSSHAWVKNIKKRKGAVHICYCHTPMRYAWDLSGFYVRRYNVLVRPLLKLFLSILRAWDKAGSKNVDYFIANSNCVAERIKNAYGRDSIVIPPPVDTSIFVPFKHPKRDYYLVVSRLIEYKRVDLAIEVFRKLDRELVVVGDGRDAKRLKKLARGCKNISFKGFVNNKQLVSLYQNAKALIHPQIEDAGITSLEAQSCGVPVVAFGRGGATETVIEGKTGSFFYKQSATSLRKAIESFENHSIDSKLCRKNAKKYDVKVFKKRIQEFIKSKKWLERKKRG
jgi:glycosyltransferase involved in cell wall biosynthesis